MPRAAQLVSTVMPLVEHKRSRGWHLRPRRSLASADLQITKRRSSELRARPIR